MIKDLTVVVPVYGQFQYLHKLLVSLLKSVDYNQIIIMDDKSPDKGTQDYLKKLKENTDIRIYRNKKNLGFGGNCNKGIKLAKTKYTCLLNSDISIRDSQYPIEKCLETLRSDKKVGIVGTMLIQDGKVNHAGVYMDWNSQGGTPRHRCCGDLVADYMRTVELQDFVTAAFWVFRTDEFLKLGGFRKEYGRGYFEDPDMCCQYIKRGYKVVYDGRDFADHVGHVSFKAIDYPYWSTPKNLETFQNRCLPILRKEIKERVAIYTAIAGGFDNFFAQPMQSVKHLYYRLGGKKELPSPVLQAKHPKIFPEQYVKEDITIWIDGNIQITSKDFAKYLLKELGDYDMMTLNVEKRSTLEEEIIELRKNPKFDKLKLEEQVAHYRSVGLKDEILYGNGIIVRRNNSKVRNLMSDWWAELEKWCSPRDQISLPYVYYKAKNKPKIKVLDINKIRKYCKWEEHLS